MHLTLLDEYFRIMGRKKFYESVEDTQKDLDEYLKRYSTKRTHQVGTCVKLCPFVRGLASLLSRSFPV